MSYAKIQPDWMIYSGSGEIYYAKSRSTGKAEYSGSDAGTVIQTVINNLGPSYPRATIFIDDDVYTSTEVTINKSSITLYTNKIRKDNTDTAPKLSRITIAATGSQILNIKIQGLLINKLIFRADPYVITGVRVDDCLFTNSNTYATSILFTGSAYVYHVSIVDWMMHDYSTVGSGSIRFDYTGSGTAQIYFERGNYAAHSGSSISEACGPVFYVNGAAVFNIHNFSYALWGSGSKFLVLASGSPGIPKRIAMTCVSDSWFEIHETGISTMFETTGSYNAMNLQWSNNLIAESAGSVQFVNDNITGLSSTNHGINVVGGYWSGSVSLGTTGSFPTRIEHVRGFAMENYGNESLTAESGSFPHGMAAPPYVVNLTPSGSYRGALVWAPSGSDGIWVAQSGSQNVGFSWFAKAI